MSASPPLLRSPAPAAARSCRSAPLPAKADNRSGIIMVARDQGEYREHYNGSAQRFEGAKIKPKTVTVAIKDKGTRRKSIKTFISDLQRQDGLIITDFDENLQSSLVDYAVVDDKDDIRFAFENGTEIRANVLIPAQKACYAGIVLSGISCRNQLPVTGFFSAGS